MAETKPGRRGPAFGSPFAAPRAARTAGGAGADGSAAGPPAIAPRPLAQAAQPETKAPRPALAAFARVLRPQPAAASEASTPPSPVDDPFGLEGFRRIDDLARPGQVSAAVWGSVFPPDRDRVLVLAGRRFRRGMAGDDAVRAAVRELDVESWSRPPRSAALAELGLRFPGAASIPPPPQVAAACDAVWPTAMRHGSTILSAADPERAAFAARAWRAPRGRCLVCGEAASASDQLFRTRDGSDAGDAIHAGCLRSMAAIGPAFGRLVVAEARRIAASMPVAASPGDADEGDPEGSWT
jgi:hypothetical protein